MKWHSRRLTLAAAGTVIAVMTTGCGDTITGPVLWHSTVTEVVRHVPAGPNTEVVYDTLSGLLSNAAGHPQAGTLFRESCNRKYLGNVLVQDWNCTALVNTGDRIYVAGGHANGPFDQLPPLADVRRGGAMIITALATPPPAPTPFVVQILAEPGGPR